MSFLLTLTCNNLFFVTGMKLFYTSSVAQQLMQSRSLHLQTPHQGGKLLPARPFIFHPLLPYHPSLIFLPKTKFIYYTCPFFSILPYVPCPQHCCPCLSPPRLLFILLCDCSQTPSGLHAHNPMHLQKHIFSLSSNIYSIKPHSRFYLFLPFCITLTLTYSCFTLLRQISYLVL